MIKRLLQGEVLKQLKRYPAVALLGPRQCGKTTLAKSIGHSYFDLENEADKLRLDLEWDRLTRQKKVIILDEAQTYPEIFNRLRTVIDQDRSKKGRFLILGSVAPSLMKNVSQSLAGRLAICELTPFLLSELSTSKLGSLWLCGGFPDGGIIRPKQFGDWQKNYLTLLAQRDLPAWGLPSKPQLTGRFFKMLAACHGQIWNASNIAASLGINYHTVNSYLDYLENAFLIYRLLPYSENVGKRLIKSPKIYWEDSGLLHHLWGVSSLDSLFDFPMVGASWEGFCILQILGRLKATGKLFQAYYYRTSDGTEIDLVLIIGKVRLAVEFKLTSEPSLLDLKKMQSSAHVLKADQIWLISRTKHTVDSQDRLSTHLPEALARLSQISC